MEFQGAVFASLVLPSQGKPCGRGPGQTRSCSRPGPGWPAPQKPWPVALGAHVLACAPQGPGCPGSTLLARLPGGPDKDGSLQAPPALRATQCALSPQVALAERGDPPGVPGWLLALHFTAHGLEVQGTVPCSRQQGNFSDLTSTFVMSFLPAGESLGASVCPHSPQRGGP